MDVDTFWQLIEATHREGGGDDRKQFDLLVERLAQESVETIIVFDGIFNTFTNQVYTAELWDAAYFISCVGGQDAFDSFRFWLVAQGKTVFEEALLNPDSLADVVRPDTRDLGDTVFEFFRYVTMKAYRIKTGHNEIPPNTLPYHSTPKLTGESHEEAEYPTLFPRLMAKLGSSCDECLDAYLNRSSDERINDSD